VARESWRANVAGDTTEPEPPDRSRAGGRDKVADSTEAAGAVRPGWWHRVGLWRAAAGMAAAAALACAITAAEFSDTLIFRSGHYHQRITALNSLVQRMRRELDVARKERLSAFAAGRQSEKDALMPILTAPDRRTIKLSRPQPQAEQGQSRLAQPSAATLIISDKQGKAVFGAEGLPPAPPAMTYRVFWLARNGGVLRAEDFIPGPDGDAAIVMALPQSKPESVLVTLEQVAAAPKPAGPVAFRGRVAP